MKFVDSVNESGLADKHIDEWRLGRIADYNGSIFILHHGIRREANWLDYCVQEIAMLSRLEVEPFGRDLILARQYFTSLYGGKPIVFEATATPHSFDYVRAVTLIDWCEHGGAYG